MDDAATSDADSPDDAPTDDELAEAARTAIDQCLALEPGESACVVTDDERQRIGEALHTAARDVTEDATIARYPPGDQHGEEPPAPVAAAMAAADVVLAPTTTSLTHTVARSDATDAGARVATLPGIAEDVFVTGLDADYAAIAEHCQAVYDQVAAAETIRITTPAGTDLTVETGERAWEQDTGIVHDPGAMSNLPAGEVFVSPTTGDGRVVVDGTMAPHGLLTERSVAFEVEDGQVTSVEDDALRDAIDDAAAASSEAAAHNLAELGIGTNVAVTELVGSVLLDEKAAGTVHVAIGDDHAIGGDVEAPIHLDGVLRDPTVSADGEAITLPTAE